MTKRLKTSKAITQKTSPSFKTSRHKGFKEYKAHDKPERIPGKKR